MCIDWGDFYCHKLLIFQARFSRSYLVLQLLKEGVLGAGRGELEYSSPGEDPKWRGVS